jgi:glycosyltransferase involved in cell wall biosynthesis
MKPNDFIVFVLPRRPWPPYAGQAKHAFNISKRLKFLGYKTALIYLDLSFSCAIPQNLPCLEKAYDKIICVKPSRFRLFLAIVTSFFGRVFRSEPLQCGVFSFFSSDVKSALFGLNKHRAINLLHFFSIRTIQFARVGEQLKIPYVCDLIDSVALNLSRRIGVTSNPYARSLLRWEHNAVSMVEQALPSGSYLRAYLAVSSVDREFLKVTGIPTGGTDVRQHSTKPSIVLSSIGLDLDYINASEPYLFPALPKAETCAPFKLVFFGSLWYEPNHTALLRLINNIFPLVLQAIPGANLVIAGDSPPEDIFRLAVASNFLLIPNPDNMYSIIKSCDVAVFPISTGSGQQNKLLEAIACHVPVVTSQIAAAPLGLLHSEHLFVCETDDEYSTSIMSLYRDPSLASSIDRSAYSFVSSTFSWSSVVEKLLAGVYT